MIAIYNTDWIFYTKDNVQVVASNIITKKIPLEFLSTKSMIRKAMKSLSATTISSLQKDDSGSYKFSIVWKKFIGSVNNPDQHLEDLH